MPKKHLNKDKKKRAVKRQGCCGLFACLYALGIKVKTAEDIEKYRRMCLEKKLVLCPHGKRWLGGTTRWDRTRILNHFGAKVEPVSFQTKTQANAMDQAQVMSQVPDTSEQQPKSTKAQPFRTHFNDACNSKLFSVAPAHAHGTVDIHIHPASPAAHAPVQPAVHVRGP